MEVNDCCKILLQLKSTDKILSNGVFKSKIELLYEAVVIPQVGPNWLPSWELSKGLMKGISKCKGAMKKFKNAKIETRYNGSALDPLENK